MLFTSSNPEEQLIKQKETKNIKERAEEYLNITTNKLANIISEIICLFQSNLQYLVIIPPPPLPPPRVFPN